MSLVRVRRGPATWLSEHVVAVVHILTTLVLSSLYLIPPTLFVLALLTTPILIGFAIFPLATGSAWLVAWIELRRVSVVLGVPLDRTAVSRPVNVESRGFFRRLFVIRDWRYVLYSIAVALWGLLGGGLIALLIGYGLGLLFAPLYVPLRPIDGPPAVVLVGAMVGGGFVLIVGVLLAPWVASVETALIRGLLITGHVTQLERRVTELQDSKLRMIDAAEAERRRIERDLHDGAQQRLLAVTMALTRARARLDRDTEQARALLDEAHAQAKEAMIELRDVARGLHPSILTEEGLESALPAIAGRCPVPVSLRVELSTRPSERTEAAAYYLVSEALTNVAKHAGARRVEVDIRRRGQQLAVRVHDDGRGGADPTWGTGLRGLQDRVLAIDGTLSVQSPQGGPTVLMAELPWEA